MTCQRIPSECGLPWSWWNITASVSLLRREIEWRKWWQIWKWLEYLYKLFTPVLFMYLFLLILTIMSCQLLLGGTNSVGISNTQTFPITDWVNSVWSCRRQNSCLLSTFECHYFICTGLMYWELGVTWIQGYHVRKSWDTACRREWGNVCQFLL